MSTTDRRISLVVPTFNRAWYINRLLHSLTWTQVPKDEFEVVIADDGSFDPLELVCDKWREQGFDINHVRVRSFGLIRNGVFSRNVGIKQAKYPIVIFTDPEIVFATDVLHHARTTLEEGTFCNPGGYFKLTKQQQIEIETDETWSKLSSEEFLNLAKSGFNHVRLIDPIQMIHGAFVSWKKDLLKIGGYDERFTEWGHEDLDIVNRLQRMGNKRLHMKEAMVIHQWHPVQIYCGGNDRNVQKEEEPLSMFGWKIGLQLAIANQDYSVGRNPGGWGEIKETEDMSIPSFHLSAYSQFISAADRDKFTKALEHLEKLEIDQARRTFPQAFRLAFLSHYYQLTSALIKTDNLYTRRKLCLYLLQRPWEKGEQDLAWDQWQMPAIGDLVEGMDQAVTFYPLTAIVIGELLKTEMALGNEDNITLIESKIINGLLQIDNRPIMKDSYFVFQLLKLMFTLKRIDDAFRLMDNILGTSMELEEVRDHNNVEFDSMMFVLKLYLAKSEEKYPQLTAAVENHLQDYSVDHILNAGRYCVRSAFYQEAIDVFEDLLKNHPEAEAVQNGEVKYHMASSMKKAGQTDAAIAKFEELVNELDGPFASSFEANIRFHLGELYLSIDERNLGREQLQLCVKQKPDFVAARKLLEKEF